MKQCINSVCFGYMKVVVVVDYLVYLSVVVITFVDDSLGHYSLLRGRGILSRSLYDDLLLLLWAHHLCGRQGRRYRNLLTQSRLSSLRLICFFPRRLLHLFLAGGGPWNSKRGE